MVDRLLINLAGIIAPAGKQARLSILIYHRVLAMPDPLFSDVDAAAFDWQMQCLARRFNVLPLSEAVDRLTRDSLPSRAVCVTFDDGYADNAEVALPILLRHRLHATFFVASGFLNGGVMFNDLLISAIHNARCDKLDLRELGYGEIDMSTAQVRRKAIDALLASIKYLPQATRTSVVGRIAQLAGGGGSLDLMMRPEQVRKLHAAGMEIGAHTMTHPILARIDSAAARAEIAESKAQLEDTIRAPVTLFAYPNGIPGADYTAEHVAMVKAAGYKAAMTTAWGVATRKADLFQLPRFTPWDQTPTRFALRLIQNQFRTRVASV